MREDPDDRRTPDDRDSERIDERVEELEARVRELRTELGRPPEGPLGLPRPPTPREVLSFTGEYAIPTAVAMLEANIRALKALQQVIRLLDPEPSVASEGRDRLQGRAADASRLTLDRLESALEDVEATIRESDLPREDAARDILEDARRINREIRDRVDSERREADEARRRERDLDRERGLDGERGPDADRGGSDGSETDLQGGTTIELTDESEEAEGEDGGDEADETDDRAEVDVEAELESIKDEMERRKSGTDGVASTDAGSEDADGDDSGVEDSDAEASDADEADADDAGVDDTDANEDGE